MTVNLNQVDLKLSISCRIFVPNLFVSVSLDSEEGKVGINFGSVLTLVPLTFTSPSVSNLEVSLTIIFKLGAANKHTKVPTNSKTFKENMFPKFCMKKEIDLTQAIEEFLFQCGSAHSITVYILSH